MVLFCLRDLTDVDFDVDRFMKELESVTRPGGEDDGSDVDAEEGSSSDMDFGMSIVNHWV